MKRILLTFFIMLVSLYADTFVCINEDFKAQSTLSHQMLFEDTSGTLSLDEILKQNPFEKSTKHSTKEISSAYWTKVTLKNCTDTSLSVVFKHPRAGLDQIDTYLFANESLVNSHKMGDLREQSTRKLLYRNSMFLFELEPNTSYTFISRLKSFGAYEFRWMIENPGYFAYHGSIETMVWGLFSGIILALLIYNFSLFLSLKEVAFLIYTLHLCSTLWHQLALNGVLYQYFDFINLEFLTTSVWVSPYFSQACLVLFPYYFFKFDSPLLKKVLLFFAWTCVLIGLFYLSALWDMKRLYLARYITPASLLILLIPLVMSIVALYKRLVGSFYFFIGQGVYLLCSFANMAIVTGNSAPMQYSWLLVPVGIVFDVVFLSLALGQKVRIIHQENMLNRRALLEQAHFTAIGQAIGNITHQWRTPISHISSQFMFLQATLEHNSHSFVKTFRMQIPEITKSIEYMHESSETFYSFYAHSQTKVIFSPKEEIEVLLKILNTKIILSKVAITLECDTQTITNYKNIFDNVVMILVENAIEAHTENNNEHKWIKIESVFEKDSMSLCISDNAGGISTYIQEMVFNPLVNTSTKNSCGFGLPIAKRLIDEKLGGTLKIKNSDKGSEFTLYIPFTCKVP